MKEGVIVFNLTRMNLTSWNSMALTYQKKRESFSCQGITTLDCNLNVETRQYNSPLNTRQSLNWLYLPNVEAMNFTWKLYRTKCSR